MVKSVPLSRAGTVSRCMRHHCRTRAQAPIQPQSPSSRCPTGSGSVQESSAAPRPHFHSYRAVDLPSVGLLFLACFLKFSLCTVPVNFALLIIFTRYVCTAYPEMHRSLDTCFSSIGLLMSIVFLVF